MSDTFAGTVATGRSGRSSKCPAWIIMNELSDINLLTPACRITDAALQADSKTTMLTSEPWLRIRSYMLQATPRSPPVEFKKIVMGLVIPQDCAGRTDSST